MAKVTPSGHSGPRSSLVSDYCDALHCKNCPLRGSAGDPSLPVSKEPTQEEGLKRLKDVGDKKTLITAAELGLVHQYRELKLAGQAILQVDFPYHYSSILYACYGNQYKILQLVEREFASGMQELTVMHTTRCWLGKNSAMVAAYQGHLETLLYIIDLDLQGKFGHVDLFKQRDVMGKTAMDWAASQGHTDALEVLVIRSLYKLLPHDSADPLVIRTRWRLVSLLSEVSKHCRDYDPSSTRRFFQEVLASIGYTPVVAAAAVAAVQADDGLLSPAGRDDSWDLEDADAPTGPSSGAAPMGTSFTVRTAVGNLVDEGPSSPAGQGRPSATDARAEARSGGGGGAGGASARSGGGASARSGGGASARSGASVGGGVSSGGGSGGGGGGAKVPAGPPKLQGGTTLTRPSGAVKDDVHITVAMLMDVVTSAYRAGMNCMGVIMYIQALLQQARYFEDLVAKCTAWEVQLLDTCRNKVEVQAVLTPTDQDPSEPVAFALNTFDKAFLSHKYVQQIFTEKWDTMGVTDFAHSFLGAIWSALTLVIAFSCWAVACPIAIILRSFFSPMEDFLQRGKVIVDSRFPWHVPLYRWLLAQCSLLVFVVLLSYRVFSAPGDASLSSAISPLNTTLAVWCFAILVEEVQEFLEEGRTVYMASGWNLMDVTMATAYLLQYLLRIGIVCVQEARNVSVLLVVNDLLAASALMAWFRVVSVLELSAAIGPLIQMMKQMLLQDVTRFALLVIVILLGFAVGMEALFKDVCLEMNSEHECIKYSTWAYDWQKQGLIGGMTFLQYVALNNAEVTDFEQKRVTGILFYLIFAVVTSILMLNLFIAMLADTYTRVSNKAQVEFRYRKACIMASFSRREAICPPYNLLMLTFGFAGNTLRRLVFGRGGFLPAPLRKNESTPLFPWYFPQGEELVEVLELQRQVVADFLRAVRVALVKDRLQADLPILLHHLAAERGEDVFKVPGMG